jgi:hypothetical protein
MRITRNTLKTVTLEAAPGERVKVDAEGFGVQEITLRWGRHTDLRANLVAAIREARLLREVDEDERDEVWSRDREINLCSRAQTELEMLDTLATHRVSYVWVGHSY